MPAKLIEPTAGVADSQPDRVQMRFKNFHYASAELDRIKQRQGLIQLITKQFYAVTEIESLLFLAFAVFDRLLLHMQVWFAVWLCRAIAEKPTIGPTRARSTIRAGHRNDFEPRFERCPTWRSVADPDQNAGRYGRSSLTSTTPNGSTDYAID